MIKNIILKQNSFRNSWNKITKKWFFTDFETKINRFQLIRSEYESHNRNIAESRKSLNQILANNDSCPDLLFEKLNPIIYLGKTDEDISLILNCIKKLDEDKKNKYKIHATFMRLLHTLNRTDKALGCFENEKLRGIFMQDLASSIIVLDKLIEEKNYNESIKFFNKYLKSLNRIPSSILNALTFVFTKIDTQDSYIQMKELVSFADERKFLFNLNSIVQIFMFSVKQNDILYALNFLAKRDKINSNVYHNLLAIGYSSLNLTNEAKAHLERLIEQSNSSKIVFKTTLNFVKDAYRRSNDKNLTENLEKIEIKLTEQNAINNIDIVEFYSRSTEGVYSKTKKEYKKVNKKFKN